MSVKSKDSCLKIKFSEIESTVVPGTFETIALLSFKTVLKKVDFPAFGFPKIEILYLFTSLDFSKSVE